MKHRRPWIGSYQADCRNTSGEGENPDHWASGHAQRRCHAGSWPGSGHDIVGADLEEMDITDRS